MTEIQIHNCTWFARDGRSKWEFTPDGALVGQIWSRQDSVRGLTMRSQRVVHPLSPRWASSCPQAEAEFLGPMNEIPEGARYVPREAGIVYGLGKRIPLCAIVAFAPAHPLGGNEGRNVRSLVADLPPPWACTTPEDHAVRTAILAQIVAEVRAAVARLGIEQVYENAPAFEHREWRAVAAAGK